MSSRHVMYNEEMDEIDRRENDGACLVIRPPEPLGIGHTEKHPEVLERVYQTGRRVMADRLRELQAFLGQGIPKGTVPSSACD